LIALRALPGKRDEQPGAFGAMDIHRLVKMANDIGAYYETLPDRSEAVSSIATHLRNFWEPRMRREIIDHAKRGTGQDPELKEIVREAILKLQ
jgi:formate dehydrogenase subunit delta